MCLASFEDNIGVITVVCELLCVLLLSLLLFFFLFLLLLLLLLVFCEGKVFVL